MRAISFAIGLALLAGAAEARPPNPREAAWFYNRPGVEFSQFEADSSACAQFGAQMVGGGAGQNHGLVGLAITGALAGGNALSFADECMIARGYRRFDIPGEALRAFGERFAAMTVEQRLALVSGETPSEGMLARHASNIHWIAREGEPAAELVAIAPASDRLVFRGWYPRPAQGTRIDPGPEDAVIIAAIRSTTGDLAVAQFTRVDPQTGLPALVEARGGERQVSFNFATRSREARPMAYVARAGTYALVNLDMLQLCLGTIAFTVEPGGVVDLGIIEVNEEPTARGDPFGPVPMRQVRIDAAGAENAHTMLSHAPDLASRAEPASFFNGVQYPCNNAFPWAVVGVVMPGAPFRTAPSQAVAED